MRQPTGGGGLGEAEAEGQCRLGGVVTGWPDWPVGPNQPWVSSSGGPVVSLDPACPAPGAPRGPETQRGATGRRLAPYQGPPCLASLKPRAWGPRGGTRQGLSPQPLRLTLWLQSFRKLMEQISPDLLLTHHSSILSQVHKAGGSAKLVCRPLLQSPGPPARQALSTLAGS